MKNLILPFRDDYKKLHCMNEQFYNFGKFFPFKIYCNKGRFLPFICPFESNVEFFELINQDGYVVQQINLEDISHYVVASLGRRYFVYSGGTVNCLDLDDCEPYCIKIGRFYSEFFWVADTEGMTKIEFSNEKSIPNVPYARGFKQWFWTEHKIASPEQNVFQVQTKDELDNVTVTYSKITDTYNFQWYNAPDFVKEFLKSSEVLDKVIISRENLFIECLPKQAKLKESRVEGYTSLFDIEFSIISKDFVEVGCEDFEFIYDESYGTVKPRVNEDCPPSLGIDIVIDVCNEEEAIINIPKKPTTFHAEVVYNQ